MEPVEILDRVIEGYESGQVTWRKYGLRPEGQGGLCVGGAVWAAFVFNGGAAQSTLPYMNTLRAIRKHTGTHTVPDWNDDPELTFSTMLDTLKTVANGLRSNT